MKKIISLVLALALVMSLAIGAAAEETGNITIKPPVGVDANAENTYKIYKVFDAVGNGTNISYTVMDSKKDKTLPTGFVTDPAGNVHYGTIDATGKVTKVETLTTESLTAIANYVAGDTPIATVTATGSANAVAKNIPNGYYYITTSTGTVVTIDSTNPNATVEDKTTAPTVTKIISNASSFDTDGKKALAQVGSDVEFTATITVGAGAKGYVFHDIMEAGFTYNNDVKLYVGGSEVAAANYTTVTEDGDTFTVQIKDEYIMNLSTGTMITVRYSAKVNSDTLSTDSAQNKAYVSYGDPNSNNKTPEAKTDTYNAKMTVTKNDGEGKALAGAGFVLKNASGAYYKYTEAVAADPDNNIAGSAASVAWYTLAEGETLDAAIAAGKVTQYSSDANGAVHAFTGLANGDYTLIENTVPAGYNKAKDVTFTVAEAAYTAENLEQTATVVNQAGSALPSTGGMGTTIFYILGGLMTVGALVLLVTKKRMTAE